MRPLPVAAWTLAAGCAWVAGTAGAGDGVTSVRFAIDAGSSAGPVWVALNRPTGEAGWVHLTLDGERVFLEPRCEIADCGMPPVVCGAALPFVRDLAAGGDRQVSLVWDGMTSVVDSVARCETRRPAVPGTYRARICWSREAALEPGGDPSRAAVGYLVRPTCVERTFTLATREVVVRP